MEKCINCNDYTAFNKGLCNECYKKKKGGVEVAIAEPKNEVDNSSNGLTDREHNYRYNVIKGRISETLIQELFLSSGYDVYRYGMENTIPGIMKLLRGVKGKVATEIRKMPDFVIQNPKTNKVFFIEVKFRKSGEFLPKDLEDYPYKSAFIILVSKKHIKCISVKELEEGEKITPTSNNYLGKRKEFELDEQVIDDFCHFAVQFFEGVK